MMATVLHMIFSDSFSWMKIFVYWWNVHLNLFLRVQLTITLWTNADPIHWRIYAGVRVRGFGSGWVERSWPTYKYYVTMSHRCIGEMDLALAKWLTRETTVSYSRTLFLYLSIEVHFTIIYTPTGINSYRGINNRIHYFMFDVINLVSCGFYGSLRFCLRHEQIAYRNFMLMELFVHVI